MELQKIVLKPHGGENENELPIHVTTSPYWVGRRPENDYQIIRPDISGKHAGFQFDQGAWWLLDNNSTNGTFLNGRRIEAGGMAQLSLGDVVYFATKGFQVVTDDELDSSGQRRLYQTKVINDSQEIRGVMQLLKVINEQRTYPHFQPIIDLKTNAPVGWEALGRASTEDGPMGPALLFQLAQQNRVEGKLSRRFRESAFDCARCHHCWKSATGSMLFLNLHPIEIPDASFLESLKELTTPDFKKLFRVVVEMPESWVSKTDEMKRMSEQIRGLGMGVAYDDFGAGQSRLADLVRVPPDYLKLDRELVAQSARDRKQYNIVHAIIDACIQMAVKTLGEGIETAAELQTCHDLRIDLGQGYYLGRPAPAYQLFEMATPSLPGDCPFVRLDLMPR